MKQHTVEKRFYSKQCQLAIATSAIQYLNAYNSVLVCCLDQYLKSDDDFCGESSTGGLELKCLGDIIFPGKF